MAVLRLDLGRVGLRNLIHFFTISNNYNSVIDMGRNVREPNFGRGRLAKIQITLHSQNLHCSHFE